MMRDIKMIKIGSDIDSKCKCIELFMHYPMINCYLNDYISSD